MQFLSCGNSGYAEFLCNVILNFQMAYMGAHRLCILCLDADLYKVLGTFVEQHAAKQISLERAGSVQKAFECYGTQAFADINKLKFLKIIEYAAANGETYFIDGDLAFFRDPEPEIRKHADYDLIFQSELAARPYEDLCTGNFLVSGGAGSLGFLNNIARLFDAFPNRNEEEVLHIYLRQLGIRDIRTYAAARIQVFDPLLFQSGDVAFNQGHHSHPSRVCIHANFRVGKDAKRYALRKCGGWFLDKAGDSKGSQPSRFWNAAEE